MIDKMPEREYMAKKRFGSKLFRRVPYGAKFIWGDKSWFETPRDGFTLRVNGMDLSGSLQPNASGYNDHDVRDWFDADNRWSGFPKFKTLQGKAI